MDVILGTSCFMVNFALTRCLIPGKVENWVCLFNFKGVGLLDVPKKAMKAMAKPMQEYFKGRLFRLFIIHSTIVIKIILKIAKKLIDPLTIQKFVVCQDKTPEKDLSVDIDLDNIEKRFGGNCPDKTDNFFPP